MKRKMLAILMVAILLCQTGIVFAADVGTASDAAFVETVEFILESIRQAPADYGFENVNWNNLSLSNRIPLYRVEDGKAESVSDVSYYLLLDGSEIVAIVQEAEGAVFIGVDFAPELNTAANEKPLNLCLVETNGVFYARQNAQTIELMTVSATVERTSATSVNENLAVLNSLTAASVTASNPLTVSEMQTRTVVTNSLALPFPNMVQPAGDSTTCWSYCLAAMGEFETGSRFDPLYVRERAANILGSLYITTGILTPDASQLYESIYYIENVWGYQTGVGSNPITFDLIRWNIDGGAPVYIDLQPENPGMGHACVIRGYSYNTNVGGTSLFSLFDPKSNTYKAAAYNSTDIVMYISGTVTYVLEGWMHSNEL